MDLLNEAARAALLVKRHGGAHHHDDDEDVCNPSSVYSGMMGARISSIFVILFITIIGTAIPILTVRYPRLKIPISVYTFSRMFGAGVLLAFAFIHLLNPAVDAFELAKKCRGGGWNSYDWATCLIMTSLFMVFFLDVLASWIVETWFNGHMLSSEDEEMRKQHSHGFTLDAEPRRTNSGNLMTQSEMNATEKHSYSSSEQEINRKREVNEAMGALMILEFGVIFHSVIIGINLGAAGNEFKTLYPVLIFHQTFEGLGLGSRIAGIPFKSQAWMPWILAWSYALTCPIAIAIGLIVRNKWSENNVTARMVSGVLDSISAGILIYVSVVEFLANDFIYQRPKRLSLGRLLYRIALVAVGCILMSVIGKWA